MKKTILKTILFLLSLNLLAQSPANLEDIPKVIVTANGIEEGNNKVTKEQLLNAHRLTAYSKLEKYYVMSYNVTFTNKLGEFSRKIKRDRFNEYVKDAITNTPKNGTIIFSNIKIAKPGDMKRITIPEPLIYKIIE